jgi:calcium/calmodulin-dependent protein kinase (CaM kinase) II
MTLEQDLLALNQQLLDSIMAADWATYSSLCDSSITCFEAEAQGHLVQGLPFHQFYFNLGGSSSPKTVTMSQPHVRRLGDQGAVISYVRLTQYLDGNGEPQTAQIQETRVWQQINGQWKHVHAHRA